MICRLKVELLTLAVVISARIVASLQVYKPTGLQALTLSHKQQGNIIMATTLELFESSRPMTFTATCPFTGVSFQMVAPVLDDMVGSLSAVSLKATVPHPLLAATLSRKAASALPLYWQAMRALYKLATAEGFNKVRWTGALSLQHNVAIKATTPRLLGHIIQDAATLLRLWESRVSKALSNHNAHYKQPCQSHALRALPSLRIEEGASFLSVAEWLKHSLAAVEGTDEAEGKSFGLFGHKLSQDDFMALVSSTLTSAERAEKATAMYQERCKLAAERTLANAARKRAANLTLEQSVVRTASIMQDLADAGSAAWSPQHTEWLATVANRWHKDKARRLQGAAPMPCLQVVLQALLTGMPQAHFIGETATMDAELCVQALQYEVLEAAQATIAKLADFRDEMLTQAEETALADAEAAQASVLQALDGSANSTSNTSNTSRTSKLALPAVHALADKGQAAKLASKLATSAKDAQATSKGQGKGVQGPSGAAALGTDKPADKPAAPQGLSLAALMTATKLTTKA